MLFRETVSDQLLGILNACMQSPSFEGFALAGGTSLALRIGHRISIDVDLFGSGDVHALEKLELLTGLGETVVLKKSPNIRISSVQGIKVDVVNYNYPTIRPIETHENIRMHSLEDIGAMKLNAIAGRGSRKDFIDLFHLLKRFRLAEIVGFYLEKYADGNEFMVRKSLTYFEDAEREAMPRMLASESWEEIKQAILSANSL
jgi:predicted nucleotidyltransferase component of viral defense system